MALEEVYVTNPYDKINVKDPVSFGGWDVFNSIFRRQDSQGPADYFGGVGRTTYGAGKNYGSKALSFLGSPTGAMLGGGLIGGISAYNQAQEERKSIKQQNKQIAKSISEIQNSKTNIINRGTGSANSLLNNYALTTNPNKEAGYSSMYSGNVASTNQSVDRADSDIAKLRTMIQRVPNKDNAWIAALSGAFGGGMGTYGMLNNMSAAKQTDKYRNWYDTNTTNQYYQG